jgi:hypothetical protein
MEQVLELVVVFFAALATGGLMVNWIGLGRAMSRLSVSTYVEVHQATNNTFGPYMPLVLVGALLGGIVLAVLSRGIHLLSGELAIAGLFVMPQSSRLAHPHASGSTNRSHALSALSFHFQHSPATFLPVLSVDDLGFGAAGRTRISDRPRVASFAAGG